MDAFSKYLEDRGEKVSAFAQRINRAPSTLGRALSGERKPSDDLADDVEAGTEGAVTAEAFVLICMAARKARAEKVPPDADRVTPAGAFDGSMPDDAPAFSQFANQEAAE